MSFFIPVISALLEKGHSVDLASSEINGIPAFYRERGCDLYEISCSRSPLHGGNRKAVGQIRKLVEQNSYDIVHCHTPIAAMCTRLACRKARKQGTKVFYTAHGFHFYKGAPLKNWLLYYPVEWLCAHFTDVLITINREDYQLAQKHMHAKRVEYVPGVGIDADKFANTQVDRAEKRREIGIPADAVMILSVGELNENKNHQTVLRALAEIDDPSLHYAFAGNGSLKEKLEELACSLGIGDRFHLLGYRRDIAELNKSADLYILPSIREGLNVSLMEAMSAGLPVICSDIRGNRDLMEHDSAGFRYPTFDVTVLIERIKDVVQGIKTKRFEVQGVERMVAYRTDTIQEKILELYGMR